MTPKEAYYISKNNPSKFNMNKDYYESIIATDACRSYMYSRYVLEGRFELGEKVIATHHGYSSTYAKNILKGRFELGEYIMFDRKYCIRNYMQFNENKTPIYYKFI